jgi:MFS family permease
VYVFALATGLILAFDSPARQAFVSEVAPAHRLRSAIAMNAAVFQATRLIGPAIASLLIVNAGTGWVFAANAALYLGPAIGLLRLRPSDLAAAPPAAREPPGIGRVPLRQRHRQEGNVAPTTPVAAGTRERGALRTTARYVRQRPDIMWTIFLVGMLGTFGLNFPIVLTAMAKSTFGGNASTYGLFNIVLAAGSAAGALLAGAAARAKPRVIAASSAAFGLAQAGAAFAPGMAVFLLLLGAMGFVNLAFQATANASVQLAADPGMRGRVMGLYMLAFMGGTPIGAPIIGVLTNDFGARAGMAICGAVPVLAPVIMVSAARRHKNIKRPLS